MNFILDFKKEHQKILSNLNNDSILNFIRYLSKLKKSRGRLFILGVGGSAGNSSHAVNDFRKMCNIETYSPTDNISEITARTNDQGWENVFTEWLKVSNISSKDILLFFSVGGGSKKNKVSVNLINAADYAKKKKAKILSIIGKKEGYLAKISDECIIIPFINHKTVTAHTETFQVFIWHLIANHPIMKKNKNTWEIKK